VNVNLESTRVKEETLGKIEQELKLNREVAKVRETVRFPDSETAEIKGAIITHGTALAKLLRTRQPPIKKIDLSDTVFKDRTQALFKLYFERTKDLTEITLTNSDIDI